MKRLFYYPHALRGAFLLMSIICGNLTVSAQNYYYCDFEENGIYYQFIFGKLDEVAVSYKQYKDGLYSGNYSPNYSGKIAIPSSVTYNSVTYKVTAVTDYAFYETGVTSVSLPSTITSIGTYAFTDCYKLSDINLPNDLKSIGTCAFMGCIALSNVTIPNGLISIDWGAFQECKGLTSVDIPNSVISICNYAFSGCSGLTSVNIPNSVISIGLSAFSGCNGLITVNIPSSVTSIGDYAFSGCGNLTSVDIPNSVISIGSNAFGWTPWYNNQPDGLIYAGRVAYKYKGTMPDNTNIIIKEGTISIGYEAFRGCSGLTAVTIPYSVTSISGSAFLGCFGLTSVDIPNSVTSIGEEAFRGCRGLTSVSIPNSVTSIGYSTFGYCSGLKDVYCYTKEVPNTGAFAFEGSNFENITLHVPASALESYKSTYPWSYFGSIVSIGGKCATPTIAFVNGKVKVDCATEGAKCVTSITMAGTQISQEKEMDISTAFTVSTYAMAEGRENSEVVTATFGLPKIVGDLNGDEHIDISDVTTLVNIILGK